MNTKRKNQKRNKKIALGIVAALIVATGGFFVVKAFWPEDQYNNQTTIDTNDTESAKDAVDNERPAEREKDQSTPQYSGENPNSRNDLTGHITFAGKSGDSLTIRTTINQYLTSGTCYLALSGAQNYSENVSISPDASTSACQGWDIPTSKLRSGAYQITITIESAGKTGTITGDVKI